MNHVNHKYIISVNDKYYRVKLRLSIEKTKTKCFSFEKYTKTGALESAILWRNKMLKNAGLSYRLNYTHAPQIFIRITNSPYIGISSNGKNWTCRYSLNGKETKRHFSIKKHGEKMAFSLACKERQKVCGKLILKNKNKLIN